METGTYQMEKVRQSHYEKSLELQLYDFRKFPDINIDRYDITIERFVSGEIMKSGKPRLKNAMSFNMTCDGQGDFHDCIHCFVIDFIEQEFSPGFTRSLGCTQAFVRFHLSPKYDEEFQDFSISPEVLKVLVDRGIHLDFWFLR